MNIKTNKRTGRSYDASLLAPKSYYESVISNMQAQGFKFLSWVTMNSSTHEYHVDMAGLSQHYRLFFYLPGKSFLVALELVQDIGATVHNEQYEEIGWDPYKYRGHWTARFSLEYDHNKHTGERWSAAYEKAREKGKSIFSVEWEDYIYSPRDVVTSTVFRWHTSDQLEPVSTVESPSGLPKAGDVIAIFVQLKQDLGDYMYPRLREVDFLDLEMYYCFPAENWQTHVKTRNREAFWKQFNLPALKQARIAQRLDLRLHELKN